MITYLWHLSKRLFLRSLILSALWRNYEKKPSEMKVALHYTLLALFILFILLGQGWDPRARI